MKEDYTQAVIVAIVIIGIAIFGVWSWMHPCLEWRETDATCSDCTQRIDDHCTSWQNYPCKKKECVRRK